jgi:hypothetical protein
MQNATLHRDGAGVEADRRVLPSLRCKINSASHLAGGEG